MLSAILILTLSGIPPLGAEQSAILATAEDGAAHDHAEPAFDALLANTAQWTEPFGDVALRIEPDLDRMLANPAQFRGDLCRIAGRIEMIERLHQPWAGVDAWFVRDAAGRPALVYVDFRTTPLDERRRFRHGRRIEVIARFYKRIDKRLDGPGQDGQVHSYAAFVGAYPRVQIAAMGWLGVGPILAMILVLGGVFIILWLYTRAARSQRRERRRTAEPMIETALEGASDLPDDPAEALAELERRSQERTA